MNLLNHLFLLLIVLCSCAKENSTGMVNWPATHYQLQKDIADLEFALNREKAAKEFPAGNWITQHRSFSVCSNSQGGLSPSATERLKAEVLHFFSSQAPHNASFLIYDLELADASKTASEISVNATAIWVQPSESSPAYAKNDISCDPDADFYSFSEAAAEVDSIVKFCQGGSGFPVYDVKLVKFIVSDSVNGAPAFTESYYQQSYLFSSIDEQGFGFTREEVQQQIDKVLEMRVRHAPTGLLVPPYYDMSGKKVSNRKFSCKMHPRAYSSNYEYKMLRIDNKVFRWYEFRQIYFMGNNNIHRELGPLPR